MENVQPQGVVVVNERLARRFWPGQDALGKRLKWGGDSPQNRNPWLTIVGVVADVANGALGSEPTFTHTSRSVGFLTTCSTARARSDVKSS